MRLLVVTSEPITAEQLREADGTEASLDDAEVMIVAPALQQDPIRFWFSDADEAIERAKQVGRSTLHQLDEGGIAAAADTGESDPVLAIQDALTTFPAERIVLFTHADSEQGYREDVDLGELDERFGIPVDRATIAGSGA